MFKSLTDGRVRTERETDPVFASLTTDVVRRHAVDADHGDRSIQVRTVTRRESVRPHVTDDADLFTSLSSRPELRGARCEREGRGQVLV